MGTAERRLEILKYLCKARKTTMPRLAEMFGVSVRTIQRDLFEVESTFRVPIEMKCGRYGGVSIIGDYRFDRAYMCEEELLVLRKVQNAVKNQISEEENQILSNLIKIYSKSA